MGAFTTKNGDHVKHPCKRWPRVQNGQVELQTYRTEDSIEINPCFERRHRAEQTSNREDATIISKFGREQRQEHRGALRGNAKTELS